MIECEKCDKYIHPDEARACPNDECGYEDLCEKCYEEHVTGCMLGSF
ncbi:hypothetical protein [Niallia taxi]|nr:hypothetical protein [Niallia taxi]